VLRCSLGTGRLVHFLQGDYVITLVQEGGEKASRSVLPSHLNHLARKQEAGETCAAHGRLPRPLGLGSSRIRLPGGRGQWVSGGRTLLEEGTPRPRAAEGGSAPLSPKSPLKVSFQGKRRGLGGGGECDPSAPFLLRCPVFCPGRCFRSYATYSLPCCSAGVLSPGFTPSSSKFAFACNTFLLKIKPPPRSPRAHTSRGEAGPVPLSRGSSAVEWLLRRPSRPTFPRPLQEVCLRSDPLVAQLRIPSLPP